MLGETTPCVYLIPAGFTGWVTIELAVAGAPPLPREDGARVILVPASGRVESSSPQELGVIDHRYFFVDASGARTRIDEPEARYGASPDEAAREHDDVVVLGFHTADLDGRRWFERFYVGRGPAGEPPALP